MTALQARARELLTASAFAENGDAAVLDTVPVHVALRAILTALEAKSAVDREALHKLTMPNGEIIECEYPNSKIWAQSWSVRYPDTGKIETTGEQDCEVVERYGLTAILEAALTSTSALPERADPVRDAAQALIDNLSATYRARNGREVGIQGDDGEKCWIIHSDYTFALEQALATPIASPGDGK